jgi:hypothetical protein
MRFGFPKPGSKTSPRGRSRSLRPGVLPLEPRQLLTVVTVSNGNIGDTVSNPPTPGELRIDGVPTDPTANNIRPVAALGVQFTAPATTGQATGLQVSYVGDVNGDDFDDFLISSPFSLAASGDFGLPQPSSSGRVYLVFGSQSADPDQQVASYLDLINTFGVPDDNILARNDRVADITQLGQLNQSTPDPSPFPPGDENYAFDGLIFQTSGTPDDLFGAAVAPAGDLNNDGFADFAIGAPGDSNNRGRVVVVYGSSTIDDFQPGFNLIDLDRNQPAPTSIDTTYIDGQLIGSRFGQAISPAGDVIADGFFDLAIGAPLASINAPTGSRVANGAAYLIDGNEFINTPASLDLSLFGTAASAVDGLRFAGGADGSRLGFSLARGGNFSSGSINGQSDLLIGAPSSQTAEALNEGRLYVVFGAPNLLNQFTTPGADPTFFIDALSVTGGTQVVNGLVYSGLFAGERLGYSVSTAGDYNGGGQHDIIVGAPGFPDTTGLEPNGRAVLIRGEDSPAATVDTIPLTVSAPDLEWTTFLSPTDIGALLGASVGVTTSINSQIQNGDNLPELLIGAPRAIENTGVAYVAAGARDSFFNSLEVPNTPVPLGTLSLLNLPTPRGFLPVVRIQGTQLDRADTETFFGLSVSGTSPYNASPFRSNISVDNDALGDILIGAPLDSPVYLNQQVPFSGGAFLLEGAFLPLGVPLPADGGDDDDDDDDDTGGGGIAAFQFPPANAAAPPFGEALVPSPIALSGLPFYRPLPFSRATYQQFLTRPGFALRTRNFYFPDQAVNRRVSSGSNHNERDGIFTLPKGVFTRGQFQVGQRTGPINHGVRTLPLGEFRTLGGGLLAQWAALRGRRI